MPRAARRYSLTPEREALVTGNIALVAWSVGRMPSARIATGDGYDDLMQVGIIGLIKAAATYIEGLSEFSTYATICIRRELRQHAIRALTARRGRRRAAGLFDNELALQDWRERSPMGAAAQNERDAIVRRCVRRLPARLRAVMEARLRGETLEQIGVALGVSKSRAQQLDAEARALLRRRLRRKGVA